MKKLLLSIFALGLMQAANAQGCTELFISEYVEGWSNNKAIELYNPTDEAKDLSNYRLERYSNGSSSASESQRLVLSGTIEPHSTFVIVIDKRDPEGEGQEAPVWDELQAKADIFVNPVYEDNNTMYFNGNDAMILRNIAGTNNYIIDAIGRIGEDPDPQTGPVGGWNDVPPAFTTVANGAESWTTDHSLIRKFDVEVGDFTPDDEFDTSIGWDSIPPVITNDDGVLMGNWESLGNHSSSCSATSVKELSLVDIVLYPNPATADEPVRFQSERSVLSYEIWDITGKKIASKKVNNLKSFDISIAKFSPGIYLLQAFDGNTSFTTKLVVR